MTFEPLGENLLTLLKRLSTCDETNLKIGIPTVLVQQIVRQILWGLDFLHTHCELIHTDLKLENVMVAVEDVEELVCACRASEHMTGVSPTHATRLVPMKESGSPHGSFRNVPGGGDWRNQREITITGSSPLPSPMHAWGRVNVGPEVNSLALIMAQMALQRKMGEGTSGSNILMPDDGESSSSDEQHRDEQRPSWASDSGASSLASVNSSATLFSMTSASTAPTSMENSLIIPTSSPAVKQRAGSPSRFIATPFSFEDDQVEDTPPEVGPSKKRLSSQSNLTLKRAGQTPPPSTDATLTPTPTPTPYTQQHHPINASLLTAKKPANANTPTITSKDISHTHSRQPSSNPVPLPTTANAQSGGAAHDRGRRMINEPRRKLMPALPKPPPRIRVKIADMGNATPMAKHFTPDIQTRPYRAPEVILGYRNWTDSVDVWSVGTMVRQS
jgi:serine/threonine-protein kinase SRPK3